jgi:hypothetical protein
VAQACSHPISLALNVEATPVREGHVPPGPVAGSLPRPVAGFTPDRAAGFTLGQVVGSIADRAGVCTRGPEVVCTLVPVGACTRDRAEATTQDHLEGKAPIVVRGVPASRASWDPSGLKGIAHPDCHFLDHRRAETSRVLRLSGCGRLSQEAAPAKADCLIRTTRAGAGATGRPRSARWSVWRGLRPRNLVFHAGCRNVSSMLRCYTSGYGASPVAPRVTQIPDLPRPTTAGLFHCAF